MAQQLTERPPITPTSLPRIFRSAARILAANGLHQGDFVEDPFDRRSKSSHATRPMSIVAALNCAVTGDPHRPTAESREAIRVLALRLVVRGSGPYGEDELALAFHVDEWGDTEGRRTESAVAVLEAAADACEVSA
ncbi:hypothetical protein ACFWFB_32715 [Streptomyces albidoflavus]|uniref:DUF6197 family protein n=1 Tax=Micromonospora aurantiaca (nom. illeg.) TaxID=47850 RepID=UPI0036546E4F